jgi:FemAB-related protein (PEP-CTERM system-associated)
MNAPFLRTRAKVRRADLKDPGERRRVEAFLAEHPQAMPFHSLDWIEAVALGTGNDAGALLLERDGELRGYLPLNLIHSPIFGRLLASSGFAVGGGMLLIAGESADDLIAAVEEAALRAACGAIELRGGILPVGRTGWTIRTDAHCGFVSPLTANDEAQLLAIPRKQRAEVRKGLGQNLDITLGRGADHRMAHYAVYARSVHALGTPVFPRALFERVLDRFGEDADILTVHHQGVPVASVLSLYHRGTVMPYWGGGTAAARALHANDRMYFELMRHARQRGCTRFDFGRSKTGTGAYHFKRNWGFEPEPLAYACWSPPGAPPRDADPRSAANSAKAALWRRLPPFVADRLGPLVARGLG